MRHLKRPALLGLLLLACLLLAGPGWKALEDAYRAKMKDAEPKKEGAEKALPELTEGQTLSVSAAIVKEGKSSPPQHFTEDTLLSAMETAGKEDMPEDAERKGLGTPATRAGILEKLVSAGFLERKKSRKTVQLLPSHDAVSLITVLPEQLQSPLLTAEWEYRLGEIERGQLAPEEFLDGISAMLKDLVGTYQVIKGTEYLFTPPREVVGKCPRCGGEVAELQKGFFCQNDSCKFAIWKNNTFSLSMPLTLPQVNVTRPYLGRSILASYTSFFNSSNILLPTPFS